MALYLPHFRAGLFVLDNAGMSLGLDALLARAPIGFCSDLSQGCLSAVRTVWPRG
jgi:hypothetical protein